MLGSKKSRVTAALSSACGSSAGDHAARAIAAAAQPIKVQRDDIADQPGVL